MALTGVAWTLHDLVSALPLALTAVLLGGVAGNLELPASAGAAGFRFCSRTVLRAGVVLLGFRLHLSDLVAVGGDLIWIVMTVAVTLLGTRWVCRSLGLSPSLALLTATGYAVCGASAIAAMNGVVEADEDEVSYAIALVTLAGTVSVFVLPVLGSLLAMHPTQFGAWAGASVHDVSQVVAAAASFSEESLDSAVVVKLSRIVLLAPIVAWVGFRTRREPTQGAPALLPGFVVGFLVAAMLRTSGIIPEVLLDGIRMLTSPTLIVALVGLGAGVRADKLRRLGGRPLIAGGVAWVLVTLVGFVFFGYR